MHCGGKRSAAASRAAAGGKGRAGRAGAAERPQTADRHSRSSARLCEAPAASPTTRGGCSGLPCGAGAAIASGPAPARSQMVLGSRQRQPGSPASSWGCVPGPVLA